MRPKWNSLILAICFLRPLGSVAQVHHNIWLRTTFRKEMNLKWAAALELQHRRQDMAGGNNPLAFDLMYSVRPWIYYQHKASLRLEMSPISFFRLSSLMNAAADAGKAPQIEYRSTIALQAVRPVWKELSLNIRPALEYRIFDHRSDVLRFRARFQMQQQLRQHFVLFGYEEVLLNVAGVPLTHLLDQNRVCAGIQWKPGIHTVFESGYIYLSRLPAAGDELMSEHNFFLQFSYRVR